ncbi:MAG TPA: nuclear transport factor 2 family protein [Nitrososphaerales archaeon]|nr:nuclear transport factor 2 family protein [Nitrososphaerales archaeon]
MKGTDRPKEVVMAYIGALDGQRYDEALGLLDDGVRIRGPAGEAFGKPMDFIEMLRKYMGRYDVKKVFADGKDVCVLYDLVTTGQTVYMSSLYQVEGGKIVSISTVFDPGAFDRRPANSQGRGANR